MLVRERMTANPVTITPETSLTDAMRLMREKKVRRLPVLDARGHLAGIVSENDLLYASPSPVTSLSVWEIHGLLDRLKMNQIMTREVVTVAEDTPLEEAARIMADKRIGGLPVMNGDKLTGIITETDIFKAFVAQLGARRPGVRVSVTIPDAKGQVAKISQAISAAGGNIVGLGLSEPNPASSGEWEIMFKVQDVSKDRLVDAMRPVVSRVLDVREV